MNNLKEVLFPQLKAKDIKPYRDELLADQDGKCAICGEIITTGAQLDHDHFNGRIRGVLCRACNTSEGALIRAVRHRYTRRDHISWTDPVLFIHLIIEYWKREQYPFTHPTFSVELGKQKTVRKKRKKRTVKKK